MQRLGNGGREEVVNHPWFSNFPWEQLYDKSIPSPFIPKVGDNFDRKYCEAGDKYGELTKQRYYSIMNKCNMDEIFTNFTYMNSDERREITRCTKPISKIKVKPIKYTSKIKSNNINILKVSAKSSDLVQSLKQSAHQYTKRELSTKQKNSDKPLFKSHSKFNISPLKLSPSIGKLPNIDTARLNNHEKSTEKPKKSNMMIHSHSFQKKDLIRYNNSNSKVTNFSTLNSGRSGEFNSPYQIKKI